MKEKIDQFENVLTTKASTYEFRDEDVSMDAAKDNAIDDATDDLPETPQVRYDPESDAYMVPEETVAPAEKDATDVADTTAETSDQTAPTTPTIDADEVARLVAEAEARGYLRGCNEQIERLMDAPKMYQRPKRQEPNRPTDGEVLILNNMRRSVWD